MNKNWLTLRQIDTQLLKLKENNALLMPQSGWVRTLRKALGMTIRQFASRLSVDPSRVVKIETSELNGAVTLRTMKTVAESIDCVFVYSFVPKSSLENMIKQRAKNIAKKQIRRTSHTMDLEAQTVDKQSLEEEIDDLSGDLLRKPWKHLWEDM